MASYWRIVNRTIGKSDVLLLILDARQPSDTMNKELVDKAKLNQKPLIYVITKSDLLKNAKEDLSYFRPQPSVFVSGKTGEGIDKLYEEILKQAKTAGKARGLIKVGVLGYPNVGKSSLINALKGRDVARISGLSGYTKSAKTVHLNSRILIIDTPGVLPTDRKNFMKSAMIGSLDFTHVKNPEEVVLGLMKKYPGRLEEFYGVEGAGSADEAIVNIALKKKIVQKGGAPDIYRMSRMILADWHKGIIRL